MKKLIFVLILFFNGLVYAQPEEVCDVFSNVLQTRKDPSKIVMSGDATIYNTPGCLLNTGEVDQGDDYPQLTCDKTGGLADATGSYGAGLNVDYGFTIDNANLDATPAAGYAKDAVITMPDQVLMLSDYDEVTYNNNDSTYNYSFNNPENINLVSVINKVTFDNLNGKNLAIGYFDITDDPGKNPDIVFSGTADNISIYDLEANNHLLIENFTANESIKIHKFVFPRYDNDIVIKAPKVVIDELIQSNSGSGTSTITIYADEIDIGTVDLGQQATLKIYPYTPGQKVVFHSNSISASSSSTMLVSSGEYYTNSFDIPGSSDVSSIRAVDENQIIDLYINGDFAPGNNPGINSDGNNGNFGDLPAANFRVYINGDLNTGGGGTTFNALVYVEGSTILGSPTYLKGALSSYDDITIKEGSKFYWDSSIEDSGLGACGSEVSDVDFQNNYTCGIFNTALTSYKTIYTQQNDVFNTCTISVKDYNLSEDHNITCYKSSDVECSCNTDHCSVNHTCTIVPEPKNKLTYTVYQTNQDLSKVYYVNKDWSDSDDISAGTTHTSGPGGNDVNITFSNLNYASFTFNQDVSYINFEPQYTYKDNDTKLMLLGDVDFSGNSQTITFEPGDYYFYSFAIDKYDTNGNINQINICAKGDIRIFVKTNFIYSGNHLNDAGCGGKIFVYVEGNSYIDANGGGSGTIPMFLYTKGNVYIENSGDSNDWIGAITAEGDIDITGENINFIYDGSADDFGYGQCQLCYAYSDNGNIISFRHFVNFDINFPRDMAIINNSDETLDDVNVSQVEDVSGFTSGETACYSVVDENGNEVDKNIVIQTDGLGMSTDNISSFTGMDVPLNCAFIYDGDINTTANFGTYEPTGFNSYLAIRTDGIDGSVLGDDLKLDFYAEYVDPSGKYYNVRLDYCNINDALNDAVVTGFLDAWDTNRNINDRNISTKIDGKDFNLTVAFIPSSNVETNGTGINVMFFVAKDNDDGTYTPVSEFKTFNIDNQLKNYGFSYSVSDDNTVKFTKKQIVKKAAVVFEICADYDGQKYYLYDYDNCKSENGTTLYCDSSNETNKICMRRVRSSDEFAIRPYKFNLIDKNEKLVAGNEFNVTIKLLSYPDGNITDANFTDTLKFTPKDIKGCKDGNITLNIQNVTFVNGEANVTLKYSEVGDINLSAEELKNGTEFASIDEDDTPSDDDLLIGKATAEIKYFVPKEFNITAHYYNFEDTGFTYFSKDFNMSADLNVSITAVNADGITTENYNKECYAKNFDLNISYNHLDSDKFPDTLISRIDANESNASLNQTVSYINLSKDYFTTDNNGTASLTVKINFNRSPKTTKEGGVMTISDIYVSDVNQTLGHTGTIGGSALFRYGRIKVSNVAGYSSSLNTAFEYQYWTDNGWEKNTEHTDLRFGDINITKSRTYPSGFLNISADSIDNGSEGITLSTTHSLPYSVKIHISVKPWLWYHPLAKEYTDPSTGSTDCLRHPCLKADFLNSGTGWGGVSSNSVSQKYSENNRTAEINASSNELNVTKSQVKKINW